ncbi:MAG: SAM-dependent methyltransferase [Gammaproteobacteria bacterium]
MKLTLSVRELPAPDASATAHSERLQAVIREEIIFHGGQISFARYMELALYAPGLGYYSAGARKFGVQGDFVTAPEISPLFARCIARQCQQVLRELGSADILEIGAGSGIMACDILRELDVLQSLPAHYFILELSAELRERQYNTIKHEIPDLSQRVIWLDALPPAGWRGVVLANELLDAMPVHRFYVGEQGAGELYVGWEDSKFVWRRGAVSSPWLKQRIEAIERELGDSYDAGFPSGYESEINLAADCWLGSVASLLEAGLLLVIDYGFPRREFYHPERSTGTLMCHSRHRAHADPLVLTGLQDITTHVDFTAVAEAGVEGGLTVAGYTTQASFLLGCGLGDMLKALDVDNLAHRLKFAQQIKTLTMPSEMGELFKVMALTRNIDMPLLGFGLQDMRGRL